MNKLAIVIPAYKCIFFSQALESIANQTCKDFTLYIGDDESPDDIKSVVDSYCTDISVVYKRFETNLGGTDLVAHWERCIDLTGDEEWIWLFSDDDVMSENCVKGFYEVLERHSNDDVIDKVFRFNLSVTDENLVLLKKYVTPQYFSVEYFLESYFINHKLRNKAVEFIFSKQAYSANGRFVNFPLAWGSDTATILKFGQKAGFITIDIGEVFWRDSSFNLSSTSGIAANEQKPFATTLFFDWIIDFISIYKGSQIYEKLINRLLYSLPLGYNLKKIHCRKDKLYFKIQIWSRYIRIKRFLKVRKIKIFIERSVLVKRSSNKG
jgi:glycosyltransferase involved in cell wall biosynthesis